MDTTTTRVTTGRVVSFLVYPSAPTQIHVTSFIVTNETGISLNIQVLSTRSKPNIEAGAGLKD